MEAIAYLIGMAIGLVPIYLFIRMGMRDFQKLKARNNINKFNGWIREEMRALGLYDDNFIMSKFNVFANGSSSFIVYTTDKKLYYFDANRVFKEIRLEDIIDIKVDITVSTTNVKRLIALTSTYDTRSSSFAHLTIITEDRNYVVNNLQDVNEMNRFKLVLEKHIKELNSINN